MTTSLDTNVLILLWIQNSAWNQRASTAIRAAARTGRLSVCGPVFSELMGLPGRTPEQLKHLLEVSGIEIEWELDEPVWQTAGLAYQGYVHRRKRSNGGMPRRMLTDLLIGAHAMARGHSLLTMDQEIYRAAFPNLRIESF